MKYTNKYNIPEPIVKAILSDDYTPGKSDITVTSLLKPAWQRQLQWEHRDDIIEDYSDFIYRLTGKIVHSIINQHDQNEMSEKRLYWEIEGKILGGQFDRFLLEKGLLQDYKTGNVRSYKIEKPEYEQQLNIYAEILRQNGYEVKELELVFIYINGWSKKDFESRDDYPPQIHTKKVELWPSEKVIEFVIDRMAAHFTDMKSECTLDERWKKPDIFAVNKKGLKKAKKLCNSRDEALDYIASQGENEGDKYSIETRIGDCERCLRYCTVKEFCSIGKKL